MTGGPRPRAGSRVAWTRAKIGRTLVFAWLVCGALLWPSLPALAHASERGYVLLLPTGYYIAGGACAVAASFLSLALVPPARLAGWLAMRRHIVSMPASPGVPLSLASLAFMALLLAAGLAGSRDPLSNPLPLTVWTLLWVGLTVAHGLFGNLWTGLNPWSGLLRLAQALNPEIGTRPCPPALGLWPALILFLAFVWLELVDPAPDDPSRLAAIVGSYWVGTMLAMLVWGEAWRERGEFLTVFFAMMARFAILDASTDRQRGRIHVAACLPGARVWPTEALPLSGTIFLLAALGAVSFDGLSGTFAWLGANGINPLEFPGRTAMVPVNTAGLAMAIAALSGLFAASVFLGNRLAGASGGAGLAAGRLVWSIVPIALAYHVAHYLVAFAVDAQYALAALADPFALGWDLFGTADLTVRAGVVMGYGAALLIWNVQAAVIVGGHVLAVLLAHALAWQIYGGGRRLVLAQLPLTVLMVGYTVFGLWLLSAPNAG